MFFQETKCSTCVKCGGEDITRIEYEEKAAKKMGIQLNNNGIYQCYDCGFMWMEPLDNRIEIEKEIEKELIAVAIQSMYYVATGNAYCQDLQKKYNLERNEVKKYLDTIAVNLEERIRNGIVN